MEKQTVATLINVVAHPHDGPDTYRKLFRAANDLDRAVRIHGDRYGWMSFLREEDGPDGPLLTGYIATFVKIDMDGAWIDMSTRSAAEDSKIETVKDVVAGLQPNFHEFRFYVDLPRHLVAVETSDGKRTISPRMAEKFFTLLFSADPIIDSFGDVEVSYIPDKEALNRIIGSRYLRKLTIHFTRPNADSLSELERRVMDKLGEMGARSSDVTYSAARGDTLKLPDEVKDLARVARRNGYVEGNVAGETFSTKDHPIEKHRTYDERVQDRASAFYGLARELVETEANPSTD